MVAVPLFSPGRDVIGVIMLSRQQVDPFTDDQIALVETFADQAAIAIENVRLFTELETRLEREEATREILQVISQSRDDEQPVLDAIVHKAAQLCNAPDAGLHIVNEARTHSRLASVLSNDAGYFRIGEEFTLDSPLQTATAIREARIVHMPDLANDPLYKAGDPVRVKLVEVDGIRSRLSVPLLKDGISLGCINLNRTEVEPFTSDEIALIETFAAQAVITIENVRQFRELQTRLEREAATREILQVISQSRDDEGPVFDVILENAARLCDVPQAFMVLANESRTHLDLAAYSGTGSSFVEVLRQTPLPLDGETSETARSVLEQEVIHIDDLTEGMLYREGQLHRVAAVELDGIRTILMVPLISGGEAIGAINLYRREVRPFEEKHIELVKTFAAQAVIAIENVRQFRELQTRLEREAATKDVLQAISQSRDDEGPVFAVLLETAARLCNAPFACLFRANPERTHLTIPAFHGSRTQFVDLINDDPLPLDPSVSLTAEAMIEKRSMQIADFSDNEIYRSGQPQRLHAVDVEGVRTVMVVPLLIKDEAIGAIFLYRREVSLFAEDDVRLVETFAAQAVIAIENVRQFRELQTRLEREAATREILQVISRSRDDETPVFDVILENAARLCEAPMASLNLLDEDGSRQVLQAHWGTALDHFEPGVTEWALDGASAPAEAVRTAALVHIEDFAETEAYKAGDPVRVNAVEKEGIRTFLAVPLLRGGKAIGTIALFRREVSRFDEKHITLVETFAAQAVIAIENVRQFKALEARTEEVQALNASLETRVEEQVGEIERMSRLKRFLPPQVADAIVSSGNEKLLSSHRALIGVLFCDIRGFTAFCETAEPEETIEVLQTYHEEMGKLLNAHGAGVDHRAGDGIMVIFNDPLPCDDPAGDAVRLAMAMRARMVELCKGWRRLGHRLGFGVGISLGYATVGMVGFEGRYEYTASGTAVNLAARLCDKALDGQILISPRAHLAVEDDVEVEEAGELDLKGLHAPVKVHQLIGSRDGAA